MGDDVWQEERRTVSGTDCREYAFMRTSSLHIKVFCQARLECRSRLLVAHCGTPLDYLSHDINFMTAFRGQPTMSSRFPRVLTAHNRLTRSSDGQFDHISEHGIASKLLLMLRLALSPRWSPICCCTSPDCLSIAGIYSWNLGLGIVLVWNRKEGMPFCQP